MEDEIFEALFEIVTFFNRPKQDKLLLKRAGVALDTALFPIIVRVGIHKKIGIVELAGEVGRDYTTVSRQIDKLESATLVVSNAAKSDGRVREVQLSAQGKAVVAKIIKARRAMMQEALVEWDDAAVEELRVNLTRLAQALRRLDTAPAKISSNRR